MASPYRCTCSNGKKKSFQDIFPRTLQDAHFPLYCTPYYGYSPPPRWTCRLKYSSSPAISCPPSPCCPARWRMTLSPPHPIYFRALHPHLLLVSPRQGLLLSPYTDPDNSDQPQPCWLRRIGGPAPPAFPKFLTLEQSLTANSSSAPLQMFLKPLPL